MYRASVMYRASDMWCSQIHFDALHCILKILCHTYFSRKVNHTQKRIFLDFGHKMKL